MAYIGQGIKQGTFKVLDTSGNTYNGSNTTFSLGTQVGSAAQLLVSHDGVIQKAGTDYTLASGGASITFSTAPASGASIFITEISGAVGGTVTPSDTSVTADKLNSALLTGHTDIGANIADADLFLTDDGAGGTLRKTAASRLKTYVGAGAGAFDIANLDIDGGTDIGADIVDADLFIVDDGAGGTNRKTTASRIKSYVGGGGLVPITTVAFSSGTELVINNCFSATYLNYMMIISLLVPQSDASLNFRFNVGGTVDSGSNYRYTLAGTQNDSSGTTSQSNGTTDEGRLFYDIDADTEAGASGVFYIHNPYGAFQRKQIHGNTMLQKGTAGNTTQYQVATDYHNSTTKNFTGINLFSSGATNWRAGSTSSGYGRVSIFGIVNS